jgi:hypothetical protein
MATSEIDRREFIRGIVGGAAALGAPTVSWAGGGPIGSPSGKAAPRPDYSGPNVIVVRFGGGARRRETIEPETTYSPFLCHEFSKRGVLFPMTEISSLDGVETGHGQGTLYILTGRYDKYRDIEEKFLSERFTPKAPTIFEYLRKAHRIPEHQALIINGEDRKNEEFFTFSDHLHYGVHYRANVLSLYRFKTYLLRRQIEAGDLSGKPLEDTKNKLAQLEALDYRRGDNSGQTPEIYSFWERWRKYYGESGLRNPRGDSLLTELAVRAIRELQPRLLMVNYNDCDYVHWGNLAFYTRGITTMDEGLRRIVETVESQEAYRDNTVFVVVPDCGRDSNPFMAVPCQHHFGSRSSHEIFALFVGPDVARGAVVDQVAEQISIAPTIGRLMGVPTGDAEGEVLAPVFA